MSAVFRKVTGDIYLLETPTGGVWSGIVLVDGDEKVLIDSSECAAHIDNYLIPALKGLGYELSDISWLCNTHSHGDHVGGHKRIVELAHVKVAVYENGEAKLKDPLYYAKLIRAKWPEHSPAAPDVLDGVEADLVLKDGDWLAGRLQLIATPGHDTDCVCFYDSVTGTLISGDSLQGNGTRTQGTALYMDLLSYRVSLSKLCLVDIQNIVSAHPFLFTGDIALGRDESEEYLSRCYQITDIYDRFIREQIKQGETDAVVIAKRLIEETGNIMPKYLFLPLYTVDSHMRTIIQ